MIAITFHTGGDHPGVKRLLHSACLHGIEICEFIQPYYPGHIGRLQRMLPVIAKWPEEEIVVCTDAYDVIYMGTEADILNRYEQLGSPNICMSAERSCYPYGWQKDEFPEVDGPYRYINAGCWIARAGAIVKLWCDLDVMRIPPSMNDQGILGDRYRRHPDAFTLDCRAVLFHNMFDAENDVLYQTWNDDAAFIAQWEKLHSTRFECLQPGQNRLTEEFPVVYHASGSSDIAGAELLLKEKFRHALP